MGARALQAGVTVGLVWTIGARLEWPAVSALANRVTAPFLVSAFVALALG